MAKVGPRHRVCVPAAGPSDLRRPDAVKLSVPDTLLARAVGLFFRMCANLLKYLSLPLELRVVAQWPWASLMLPGKIKRS